MHCIEVAAKDYKQFKQEVERNGGQVSVISRYSERSVRILDVEVSKDTAAISRVERVLGFKGV